MSETLTRAEVEKHLETARQYAKANALGSLIDSNHLIALCNMALGFLAMQPRPISEAPRDGTVQLVYASPAHGLPGFWCACSYHPDAGWCVDELRETTHFISLSSLQEPKE